VRYIPGIGVDVRLFEPAPSASLRASIRRDLGVSDDAFMLTMVAELAPVKRHEHVLQALARVRDDRVVIVFVGEGLLDAALRELADRLGVSDRVRWAGYRTDVPAILAASDAGLLASEREGLARSVLEAMAAGKPVIGTRTRGIADAIGPDAGWVVAKNDADALATAIEDASAHPEECSRKGALARSRVHEHFALTRIIADYEELYREALASRI
jgi:glycosyltransferase involved in cell wall biosynthesis